MITLKMHLEFYAQDEPNASQLINKTYIKTR
jgi:hypothetical protein